MRYRGKFTGCPKFIGLLIPVMILASGCSHTVEPHRPNVSTSPAIPIKLSPRPADRAATATALPLAKPVESTLPITLAGDLTPLQDAVSAAVPESFDEGRSPLGREFRWTFQRQGAPQVFVQNGQLVVHAEYRGDIELKSSMARTCHLDPVYPTLDWNARLTTKQEGPNLVLRPESPEASIGLKPGSDDKCNLFAVPLKEQLSEFLNPKEINEQMSQAVTHAAVAIPIHGVWTQLHGPYVAPLASLTTPLCIYPDPSQITLGPVEGTLQQAVLRGVAKVDAHALITQTCDRPRIEADKIAVGRPAVPIGQPFILTTMLPVPYQMVSQRLQENLFHTEVTLPERGLFGEHKLTIEKVSATDAGGKVLITTDASGYVNGPMYFTGSPQLEGTVLTVPDVQMDIETRRMLDAEKSGLWNQVDQALKDKVRRAARIDLADQIAAVKKAVGGPHKTADLTLDIGVGQIRPQRVYSTPQSLLTELAIEGTAKAEGRMSVQATSAVPPKSAVPRSETLEERQQSPPTTEERRKELFETPRRP